jgi:hypothetical protein
MSTSLERVGETYDGDDLLSGGFEFKMLVPFGAGDNRVQTLRFPAPTMLKMETVPVHVAALRYVLPRPNNQVQQRQQLRYSIVDRSPVLRDNGVGAGDPLGVHVSRPVADNAVQASVVLSLVFSRNEDTLDPSDVVVPEDDPDGFLRTLIGLATGQPSRVATSLATASELLWNAERIVQATLALVGVANTPVVDAVFLERPSGWQLARSERDRRFREFRRIERVLADLQTNRWGRVNVLWNDMWSSVVRVREGTNVPVEREVGPGFFDLVAAGAIDPTTGASRAELLGLEQRLSAVTLTTGADADDTGGGEPPQEEEDDEQGSLPADLLARIYTRPRDAILPDASVVDQTRVREAFDTPAAELKDLIVARFLEHVRPFESVTDNAESGVYATATAAAYYGGGDGSRARLELERAFDDAYDRTIAPWKQEFGDTQAELRREEQVLNAWIDSAIATADRARLDSTHRLTSALILAEAMLLQTLGAGVAPVLRMSSQEEDPTSTERLRRVLVRRLESGCAGCDKRGIKWLTLGELARILVRLQGDEDGGDGDDDGGDDDGGDDGGGDGDGGDGDGGNDDQNRYVVANVPTSYLVASGADLRQFASNLFGQVTRPVEGWRQSRLPVFGLDRLAVALRTSTSMPVHVFPFTEMDADRVQVANVVLEEFQSGQLAMVRPTIPVVASSLQSQLSAPWPAARDARFRVVDALHSLIGFFYFRSLQANTAPRLAEAAASLVEDGTMQDIAENAASALSEVDVIDRCSAFDGQPLKKLLCEILHGLGYTKRDSDGGIAVFALDDGLEELSFRVSDIDAALEYTGDDLNAVGLALDSLFALPRTNEWRIDEPTDVFTRRLPSLEEREGFRAARTTLTRATVQTTLITGISALTVFALFCYVYFGTPLAFGMAGRDAADLFETPPTGPEPLPTELAELRPTNAERIAVMANTLWVRFAGGGGETGGELDTDAFLPRLRFLFTGLTEMRGDRQRLTTLPLSEVETAPLNEEQAGPSLQNSRVVVTGVPSMGQWVADGIVDVALSVAEWTIREYFG